MFLLRTVPYVLLAAFAAFLWRSASHFQFHHRAGTLGPDFWPKLLLGLLIAACAYEVVRIFLTRGRGGASGVLQDIVEESEAAHGGEYPQVAERSPGRLLAGVALTALYVWVIQDLGFFAATLAYVFAFIALGGYRRWGVNATVSLAGTALMMFFFMRVVYVSLPVGHGAFAEFTFWLMQLMGIR